MVSRVIERQSDIDGLARFLRARKLPVTVSIAQGRKRSDNQNRTMHMWMQEIALQLGDQTSEEVRGFCKLTFGVPIRLRDEAFAWAWESAIQPLPYEQRLKCMMQPIDLPVTRDMSTKEKAEYLDSIQRHYAEMGIRLTDPEALKYATIGGR